MKALFTSIILILLSFNTMDNRQLLSTLDQYVGNLESSFKDLSPDRKERLQELADYFSTKKKAGEPILLTFICTHNSRRSHVSQIWAQVAAHYYGVENVKSYSGGTEATAFNYRAVAAMQKAGFDITVKAEGANPLYQVRFSENAPALEAFSKVYSDKPNPQKDFCAIMTCSDADQNCPIVFGAEERISLPYDDPKNFDGTELEAAKYEERVKQIGVEIFYAFSLVK